MINLYINANLLCASRRASIYKNISRVEGMKIRAGVKVQKEFTLQSLRGKLSLLGDSARLMGLVLAPHWRTEQVSVRMILEG